MWASWLDCWRKHKSHSLKTAQLKQWYIDIQSSTVYPKKYAHGFVVLCFVVVMQSFIMNSHEVFIHIHQGCFAGTGAIVRLPQCQWSKPDGYGKISLCITTTKHSKAKTVCIFLGIYCIYEWVCICWCVSFFWHVFLCVRHRELIGRAKCMPPPKLVIVDVANFTNIRYITVSQFYGFTNIPHSVA